MGTVDDIVPESQLQPHQRHPDNEWEEGLEFPDAQIGDDPVESPELGTNQVSGTGGLPPPGMPTPGPFGPTPAESSGMVDQGAEGESSRSQRQPLQKDTHESEDHASLEGAQPLPSKSPGPMQKRRAVDTAIRMKRRRRSVAVVTRDMAVSPKGWMPVDTRRMIE